MSIERVVAVLTPAFAALAGLVSTLVGQLVPGVSLNKTDLTAIFIAGAIAAAGAALKWLHGRSQFTRDAASAGHWLSGSVATLEGGPAGPALEDIERLLKAHTDQIVQAIGGAVHAPPSVDQVVEAMAKRLVGQATTPATPAPTVPAA